MENIRFYEREIIEKVKEVPITSFLQSVGLHPIKEYGRELIYLSPLREEKTPSFSVNIIKNSFNDFGGSEEMKGDIIRLVRLFYNCGFLV
ncbi:CHC2 zinc finger domain-containing protein [Telluribacter humicola]|uniref:CHC2 zinc finger domain-containing protein n=1 Tax=Telluribacter humicola TaxID=1720261 RepID=UPI001A96E0FA|nr:CHC2 zinc finger domain-containing protein [Telluribacter humicola]